MDRLEGIKKAIKQPLEGLLYDLDLMPEQCKTPINELRSSVVECQYKEIERLKKEIKETLTTLKHARIFIDSRQKMHNDGVLLYDECLSKLQQALKEG